MMQLADVDSGLKSGEVLTMEVPLNFGERSDADARALYDRMRLELGAVPGVSDVGVGSTMPLRASQFQLDVKAEGKQLANGEAQPRAEFRAANPEYFSAAGIPLIRGREFATTDRAGSQLVVVINKTLADKFFPDRDPIGQRIAWTGDVLRFIGVSGDWRTVVGVVGDTRDGGLDAEPRPVVFLPFAQEQVFAGAGLVIRSDRPLASPSAAATRVLRGVSPRQS